MFCHNLCYKIFSASKEQKNLYICHSLQCYHCLFFLQPSFCRRLHRYLGSQNLPCLRHVDKVITSVSNLGTYPTRFWNESAQKKSCHKISFFFKQAVVAEWSKWVNVVHNCFQACRPRFEPRLGYDKYISRYAHIFIFLYSF